MAGDLDADASAARLALAVGGESPSRFRGRILLERAAWLMTATDRTLQDIAAECGFTGYDVFTRAFRREFGALPSAWRTEPTSYVIDAPGDVHFHPPDGLRLPARHRSNAADLVVQMAERHVRLVGDLVERDVVERDVDALAVLVGRMEHFAALVHDTPPAPHAGSLRHRLDRAGPAYVEAVARVAATGRFDEAVVDAFSPDGSPEASVRTLGAMVVDAVTDADGLRVLATSH
ncbi:hypothetical protein GCM10023339_09550 [Alloalcanivorax gelatiniphagus]